MRALFGFDPDRGGRDAQMAERFEETLGYWGKDYVLQMLRGPGSPWRAMNRARAQLDPLRVAAAHRAQRALGALLQRLPTEESDELRTMRTRSRPVNTPVFSPLSCWRSTSVLRPAAST